LTSGDQTPGDHLKRDPSIGSKPLGQELRRKLSEQERQIEDRLTGVVIVGVHAQITQHVVGSGLQDISSIKLQRKESDTGKYTDAPVDLL
jgi:hypothetical protein